MLLRKHASYALVWADAAQLLEADQNSNILLQRAYFVVCVYFNGYDLVSKYITLFVEQYSA